MMRRMILAMAGLAAGCGWGAAQTAIPKIEPAGQTQTLDRQIAALVAQPAVSRDHWGIQVTTLDGKPIYSLDEAQLFQPASNAKLFTTAAVIALLPASHTFTTRLRGSGRFLEDGTLQGNVYLEGVGDANLSGRNLPYVSPSLRPKPEPPANNPLRYLEDMADQVKANGLTRIEGDVIGDDALFKWEPYPQDWSIDDAVWEYGAPVSALTVADNTLNLTVSPRRAGTSIMDALATIDQAVPYYTVEMHATSTEVKKPTLIRIDRSPGSRVVRVYGYIAEGAKPDVEDIAIEDPAEYAAMALTQFLTNRGIAVTGTARAFHATVKPTLNFIVEANEPIAELAAVPESNQWPEKLHLACVGCDKTLATHVSSPLSEDVVVTNKVSQNLHAELMLHQLGLAITGNGSTAQGVRVVRQFLVNAGIDKDDFIFFDGSGLSGHDLVTPRATAKLLQFAATQPWFADWKASLPVGGEDGTLETRFAKSPLKDHLFAKTGTLGEARALSGYLDCASGRTVIFSIMVGNHLPGNNTDRDAMDKIVAAIAAAE
jgi:serine-type D-Ala-D-Ala carboxypeptidase/endopeptidase (penicillin-binding protein 4)